MKGRADLLRTVGLMIAAALALAFVRAPLFDQHRRVKETSDIYPLPPPREVSLMSLGYRAALADMLWAHLMVSQGLHTIARRRYENIIPLIGTINELDPTFRDPYRMADALVTFNSKHTPVEDARAVRAIMERGVQNRPLDAELWLGIGEFTAFIAPGTYLTDPAEQEQWRTDGARMLERAAELSGNNAHIAWQAIGGARYLSRAGARDAEIRFLQRVLVVTDDESLKEKVRAMLGAQRAAEQEELFRRLERGVWDMRHHDLPYVTRLRYMVLGPPRDPAQCAGPALALDPACSPSFRTWEDRTESTHGRTP
ncbi:Hypothetical protein A7982_03794 [Minicystis rosea]|nr:Hypothetical protein A7982_03794 [Minicystis rosea]